MTSAVDPEHTKIFKFQPIFLEQLEARKYWYIDNVIKNMTYWTVSLAKVNSLVFLNFQLEILSFSLYDQIWLLFRHERKIYKKKKKIIEKIKLKLNEILSKCNKFKHIH